ncbi:ubiquitin-specific protease ubp1 [Rhizina undulata]
MSYSQSYPYAHQPTQLEVSPGLLISLIAGALGLAYIVAADTLQLPSLPEVLFIMIPGALFGPGMREHLQNALGQGSGGLMSRVRNRAASFVGGRTAADEEDNAGVVGGLWNAGNTCYQNSILQAFSSLEHLKPHLDAIATDNTAPSSALSSLIETLNNVSPSSRAITPPSIIVRGTDSTGWRFNEQQDAQEFFQKLIGLLERDVKQHLEDMLNQRPVGFETLLDVKDPSTKKPEIYEHPELSERLGAKELRNPFEGQLAQRVGCLKCGYVEAINLQPFTSLSLTLPSARPCTIAQCLDEFTQIEHIPDVECDKCTLIYLRSGLSAILDRPASPSSSNEDEEDEKREVDSLKLQLSSRLQALTDAIEEDNFSPAILKSLKSASTPKSTSTKTKHVMIARPPPVLVLHMNRSSYDIVTGRTSKNYAAVGFPPRMNLGRLGVVTRHDVSGSSWGLGTDPGKPISKCGRALEEDIDYDDDEKEAKEVQEKEEENGMDDEAGLEYELKSVVSHYGIHSNGHYVCYRKYEKRWFRISDHEVSPCREEDVIRAGNAFMIFYERITDLPSDLPPPSPSETHLSIAASIPLPLTPTHSPANSRSNSPIPPPTPSPKSMQLLTPPASPEEKISRPKTPELTADDSEAEARVEKKGRYFPESPAEPERSPSPVERRKKRRRRKGRVGRVVVVN